MSSIIEYLLYKWYIGFKQEIPRFPQKQNK
jgi:hypothetical protein